MFGNKITNRITKISKSSPKNNSETNTNKHDKEIPKKRCMLSEERQKIIADLGLIFLIIEEVKETFLNFSQETVKVF